MTVAEDLLAGQTARFARLDRALPAAVEPPEGDVVTAALPDGSQVAGVLVRSVIAPDSPAALWSALDSWELYPLLGGDAPISAALPALLARWRRMLDLSPPGPDSACTITWPSRDAEAGRALLDHGFVPLTAVAVRQSGMASAPGKGPVRVRRARPADVDTAVELALAELAYSTLVGGTVARPSAARVKRDSVAAHIEGGDLVLLAELDGVTVGLAECWTNNAEPGSWAETRLRPGRWGYVNCLSVLPDARGAGVGRALMAQAHHELHRAGANATFLYYSVANPLSSVFWARQGYRPLWTLWEARPAGTLR